MLDALVDHEADWIAALPREHQQRAGASSRPDQTRRPYRCLVAAGNRVTSARIKSLGPTGTIVDTAICSNQAARSSGQLRFCQRDENGATLPVGSRIVCSAVFPDSIDHEAEITVVNANGATVGKPLRLALLNPVYEVWERTDTVASVGQETCLLGLDGKILAKREVQIRAG